MTSVRSPTLMREPVRTCSPSSPEESRWHGSSFELDYPL